MHTCACQIISRGMAICPMSLCGSPPFSSHTLTWQSAMSGLIPTIQKASPKEASTLWHCVRVLHARGFCVCGPNSINT